MQDSSGRKPSANAASWASYRRAPTERLHENVVRQVAQQIISGAVAPEDLIPTEPELAGQFGVSRTVIREAVRILASKGLIVVRHGSGMRVQQSDMWNHLDPLILFETISSGRGDELLDELLEVRLIFETEAAAMAAMRRTIDDLASLRTISAEMAEVSDDPASFTRLDSRFHDQILVVARNRLLREAMRPVGEVLDAGRSITNRQPRAVEGSLSGHKEIVVSIEDGDSDKAREAMRSHILQFERDIRAALTVGATETAQEPITVEGGLA